LLILVAAACSSSAATATPTATTNTEPTATVAPTATAAPTALIVGTGHSATLGDYLTGPSGMTLYVRSSDSAGVSTCTDATCMSNWPALTVAAGQTITGPSGATGTFGTLTWPNGSLQATYNGWPLYYFGGDAAVGDTTGQGQASGVWSVAPLNGAMIGSSPAASSSPSPVASPSDTSSASPVASPSDTSSPSASDTSSASASASASA